MKKEEKRAQELEKDLQLFVEQLKFGEIKDKNKTVYTPIDDIVKYTTVAVKSGTTLEQKIIVVKNGEIVEQSIKVLYPKIRNKIDYGYIVNDKGDIFSRRKKKDDKFKWLTLREESGRGQYSLKLCNKGKIEISYYGAVALAFGCDVTTDKAYKRMINGFFKNIVCHHIKPIPKNEELPVKDVTSFEQRRRRSNNCKIDNLSFITREEHGYFSHNILNSNLINVNGACSYFQIRENGKVVYTKPVKPKFNEINEEQKGKELNCTWQIGFRPKDFKETELYKKRKKNNTLHLFIPVGSYYLIAYFNNKKELFDLTYENDKKVQDELYFFTITQDKTVKIFVLDRDIFRIFVSDGKIEKNELIALTDKISLFVFDEKTFISREVKLKLLSEKNTTYNDIVDMITELSNIQIKCNERIKMS